MSLFVVEIKRFYKNVSIAKADGKLNLYCVVVAFIVWCVFSVKREF